MLVAAVAAALLRAAVPGRAGLTDFPAGLVVTIGAAAGGVHKALYLCIARSYQHV